MQAALVMGIGSAVTIAAAAAVERRSHWLTFLIAVACVALAVSAFLVGSWIGGVAGIVGYLIAMRRWVNRQEAPL
ncbi:MAG: hypothetical protein U9Q74_08310 [Gemmatimonadota bacterium]|nr:hypothetical protein [Gemmatimonadota bacterium]